MHTGLMNLHLPGCHSLRRSADFQLIHWSRSNDPCASAGAEESLAALGLVALAVDHSGCCVERESSGESRTRRLTSKSPWNACCWMELNALLTNSSEPAWSS